MLPFALYCKILYACQDNYSSRNYTVLLCLKYFYEYILKKHCIFVYFRLFTTTGNKIAISLSAPSPFFFKNVTTFKKF